MACKRLETVEGRSIAQMALWKRISDAIICDIVEWDEDTGPIILCKRLHSTKQLLLVPPKSKTATLCTQSLLYIGYFISSIK